MSRAPTNVLFRVTNQEDFSQFAAEYTPKVTMAKRPADDAEALPSSLKRGERPVKPEKDDEVGDYEDEFEDEFESENEMFEAGVDGRPDSEREAEESRGMWFTPVA